MESKVRSLISLFSSVIDPLEGSMNLNSNLTNVVLPDPVGPTSPMV